MFYFNSLIYYIRSTSRFELGPIPIFYAQSNVFGFQIVSILFQDIDECAAVPGLCEGGKCVNSIGSFSCECPSGQRRHRVTNNCEDIDECEDPDICTVSTYKTQNVTVTFCWKICKVFKTDKLKLCISCCRTANVLIRKAITTACVTRTLFLVPTKSFVSVSDTQFKKNNIQIKKTCATS